MIFLKNYFSCCSQQVMCVNHLLITCSAGFNEDSLRGYDGDLLVLLDSLVDSIILAALHREYHVATLSVSEADVLTVLGVPGPGEADGGDPVHQDARHVEDVLIVFQYWLEVVGGPHVHDEVTPVRFHPAYDGIRLSHVGVVRESDSCPLVYVVRISGGNREVHPVSVLVIFPSSNVLTVLRSGSM